MEELLCKPIRKEEDLNLVFMDDSGHQHRIQVVWGVLRVGKIERMEWSPLSPDIKPIEHMWNYFTD